MKIRSAKVLAAGAAAVLAVPGLASVASAHGHHHEAETHQIAEANLEQAANAHSGGNDVTVDVDQTDGETNTADTNSADVTAGGATAENSADGHIVQEVEPHWGVELMQVTHLDVAQMADGNSGDNTASVTITQPGTDNSADGNSASVTTGDASASNSSEFMIVQKTED